MRKSGSVGLLALAIALVGNAPPSGEATKTTAENNAAVAATLPLSDQQDFIDARRGLLAKIEQDILNPDGSVAWEVKQFDFLEADPPSTVNPSLWRQSQLSAIHGLFEVMPGIYQLRGYDVSVMTLIEGKTGWIVVDPLLSAAPAAAGLELANQTLGKRPVSAVIYTHSHGDHFGGVRGVVAIEDVQSGKVPVIAPHGFTAEVVGESVLAGTAMSRRAQYQFATSVPSGPDGAVGVGLGPKLSTGSIGLIPPTKELSQAGETMDIDGVRFEFFDAGGTEAPSEFVFYIPQYRALHTAEVVTRTFHNVLTPRGALVRDSLAWSRRIDTILTRFADKSDVMLASHHWPSWGTQTVSEKLRNQRDVYRYVHDQTLRMANQGLTMDEIAEQIGEPDFATTDFGARGYYGTFEHNAKAVYQRYFGWWNAVPADYNGLPKTDEAKKWVAAIGGEDKVLEQGKAAFANGEYRWAARLLQTLMFAAPGNDQAREWLASTYEQLGFQSEAGSWRNIYLAAAGDLRTPPVQDSLNAMSDQVLASIPTADLFDALATRFNPAKYQGAEAVINFTFPDTGEALTVDLRKSVMFPRLGAASAADVAMTIDRADLNKVLARQVQIPALVEADKVSWTGNPMHLFALFGALDEQQPNFEIVEP